MSDKLFFGPSKKYTENFDKVFGKKISRAEAIKIADENYQRIEKAMADEVEQEAREPAVWEDESEEETEWERSKRLRDLGDRLFERKEQTLEEKLRIMEEIYLEKRAKNYKPLGRIVSKVVDLIKEMMGGK